MKKLVITAALCVASLGAFAAGAKVAPSDDWADKAFTKDEQARMERTMATVELSSECGHYRALMKEPSEQKNKEGEAIAKAVMPMAREAFGKLYDEMVKDPAQASELKAAGRDFVIGMFYGSAMERGRAEGVRRSSAAPLGTSGKNWIDSNAQHLYRERNCALLPRAEK